MWSPDHPTVPVALVIRVGVNPGLFVPYKHVQSRYKDAKQAITHNVFAVAEVEAGPVYQLARRAPGRLLEPNLLLLLLRRRRSFGGRLYSSQQGWTLPLA
jgi:hypothetical protein